MLQPGQQALVFVRPEAIALRAEAMPDENVIECTVDNLSFEGAFITISLKAGRNQTIVLRHNNDGSAPSATAGDAARIRFSAQNALVLYPTQFN
jgi:ABC-type Fe3+/spermidine/putrescine transport system ATPase subunit